MEEKAAELTVAQASDIESRANALKDAGNRLLVLNKFAQAAELYTQAIELLPTAIFYSNRAMAYIKQENYGLAIIDANEAIRRDPNYLKAYYRRASANFALSKYKVALKDFKAVLKLVPNDQDAQKKFKMCERAMKEAAFAAAIESEETVPLSQTIDVAAIPLESSYDGPGLENASVLSMDFVEAAIERFKQQKQLPKKYVLMILLAARERLLAQRSLLRLRLPDVAEPCFTVCGDTHGQFYDLLNIFTLGGMPSATNPYLFNGDFVDRGSFSFEVVTTLLMLSLAAPEGLYMLRGNHESKNMNKIYGFEGEVKAKYDDTVMSIFSEVFNLLPLAAVLQDTVFIVHGGLSCEPNVTLEDIEAVTRNREPPEGGLMSDLLWSDPQPGPGKSPSKRGIGFSFGPDVTERFCERNGLSLVIRSHEVKDEGYEVAHNSRCITVFSAPNYCDQMGNKGAFIRFGADMVPRFTQFDAVPHPPIRPMAYASAFGAMGL